MEKLFPVPAVSKVLFVRVSVVALPTNVSVAAGRVRVPVAAAVGWRIVVPELEPGIATDPPVPPTTYIGDMALAFVPSYTKYWLEQAERSVEIVPIPSTFAGGINV